MKPRSKRTPSRRRPVANILVVEDELGMREWLTEILEGASHRVFAAQDGVEARSLAKLHSLDLVITDMSPM